jgi:hypothetical protein
MRFTPILTLALALAAFLPLSALAQPADQKPEYKLKSDTPHTGTHLRHNLAVSRLPYDKTYTQLSDEDKHMLRSLYENMGPDDEPPFPLRGYKAIFKALSVIQQKMLVSGKLDIAVIVDANGEGTSVKIYSSPDPEIARVVATLMMIEKYKPAMCSGQPCEQEFPLKVNFTLTH